MKRITSIILIMLLLCGCAASHNSDNTESHAQITINLPTDNTVNGYRQKSAQSVMPSIIAAEDVKPGTSEQGATNPNITAEYIGNSNSRVFHKTSCGSANTMKEENKVFFKNREEAINTGYSPCKRCKP